MASKAAIIKFQHQDKASIKGPIGHSRTGACTSSGRCQHGMRPQMGRKGKK